MIYLANYFIVECGIVMGENISEKSLKYVNVFRSPTARILQYLCINSWICFIISKFYTCYIHAKDSHNLRCNFSPLTTRHFTVVLFWQTSNVCKMRSGKHITFYCSKDTRYVYEICLLITANRNHGIVTRDQTMQ